MPVKILELCPVSPPPESAAQLSLPFTFFDLLWLKLPPVERLFFYESPYPETFFSHSILPNLKHSLSLCLQHFLFLAGNLAWPPSSSTPIIQYKSGNAISLTVAQSNDDFHRLYSNNIRPAKDSHSLIPHLTESDSQISVMAIQITFFPNSGFSIGITAHHAVLDGNSSTMFVKSWASISKFGENRESPPFFDRETTLKDRFSELDKIYSNEWLKQNGAAQRSLSLWKIESPPDQVRGGFEFSNSNLNKLKELVITRLGNQNYDEINKKIPHVSNFTVAYAYSIVCLVKAKEIEARTNKIHIVVVADCRARLQPPIPSTYFGNCLRPCSSTIEVKDIVGDDGIAIAAREIGEAIETSLSAGGVVEGAENWISNLFNDLVKRQEYNFSVAGSNRLGFYSVDFGWGRPRKVETTSIDRTGAIGFSDGRDGGIEIGVVLSKLEMERFAALFADGLIKHERDCK